MKTMKRVISTALLLCIMAALMSVSAFAAIDPVKDYIELTSSTYELDEGSGQHVALTSTLVLTDATLTGGQPVEWYKNGVYQKTEYTAGGVTTASFGEGAFNVGPNVIRVDCTIDGHKLSKEITINKHAASRVTTVELDQTYASVMKGATVGLTAYVNGVANNNAVTWVSMDPNVASVNEGVVLGLKKGTTTIKVTAKDNSVAEASCVITVNEDPAGTVVTISPIVTQLQKNQTINLDASVTGTGRFDHWYVADNMGSYVTIGNSQNPHTTLTARAATNQPIRLYAYSDDGASAYIQFTIVAAESLMLEASPASINNGATSTVYVVNAFAGETFIWNITSSATNGVLTRSNNLGSAVELVAGPVSGTIKVTATSNSDTSRTASVTVYVNSEAAYGAASINPSVATWSAGQGNLTFEVKPAFYKAYVDGKLLTPNSGYYTYYNGILTIKTSLLSTLSSGEHSLKVYTSTGNGYDGLVYATIFVNGSASSVYGDNAHVRGSGYNLYFTSSDPIKEVYISNQWIDPANYSVDGTGRRLTLNSNFLNQLGYGNYTMKLVTQNGYTETTSFRIVTANYAPATGDNSNVGAWVVLLTISLAGAVALIPRKKQQSTDLIG